MAEKELYELRTRKQEGGFEEESSDGGIHTGTDLDAADMHRLGKKQEFKVSDICVCRIKQS